MSESWYHEVVDSYIEGNAEAEDKALSILHGSFYGNRNNFVLLRAVLNTVAEDLEKGTVHPDIVISFALATNYTCGKGSDIRNEFCNKIRPNLSKVYVSRPSVLKCIEQNK